MITKKIFFAVFTVMFLFAGFQASVYAAGEPVGIIISMYNGAWVERDGGAKESLTLKSPIYRGDTVSTDRTGKAQILFNDDTTVAVAPKSTVNIDDFVFNDNKKPYFSVKVVEGASRVISGKIVEQNPIGFKMSSPHGTAGIRGTIVSVVVGPQDDIFAVESIDPRHFVDISQNTNILNTTRSATEGYSIIVNDNPAVQNMQRKTTIEERSLMNEVFSSRPAPAADSDKSGTAADTEAEAGTSDTKTATKSKDKKEEAKKDDAGAVTGDVKSDSVAGDGKTEAIVDNKNTPGVGDNTIIDTAKDTDVKDKEKVDLPQTFNAFYNGNLNATKNAPANFEGKFGFKVDVGSGRYSDGYMNAQAKGAGVFNASNGRGTVNRDGSFSASGFNASGTGDYANVNGGSMQGKVTVDGAIVDNWLVYNGDIELVGGNGTGHKSDALNNNPFNDKKASYAGNLTSNSPPQGVGSLDPEQKFGFNLLLTSGVISDAYMLYVGDEGTMTAVNGKGRATAANANFFGSFEISGFTVKGYDTYFSNNGGNALLKGNMVNGDQGVQITSGNIGGYAFTGGTGSKVDTLPKVEASRRGTYTLMKDDGGKYFAYGFKLDLIGGNLSEIYMYGGLKYTNASADPVSADVTSFWVGEESGKINADGSVNIRMKNAIHGSGYSSNQYFSLVGKFTAGYTGFSGGIRHSSGAGGRWPGDDVAAKNGPWENIPFMTAYYDGGTTVGNVRVTTGFKLNLVSGSITKAYLMLIDPAAIEKLSAYDGRGVFNPANKKFEYKWDVGTAANPQVVGTGSYANVGQVKVSGGLAPDYSQAGAQVEIFDRSTNLLFDTVREFSLPKMDALSPVTANHSSDLLAYNGVGGVTHSGGKVGFSVNLFDGKVTDAGFHFTEAGNVTTVANGGDGTLIEGLLKVGWELNEIITFNTAPNVRYNTAKLEGPLGNSRLTVNRGASDLAVGETINFNKVVDYTSEKKGTVSGTLSGGASGTYSFNANLYSGAINSGKIDANVKNGNASFSGGVGYVNGGNFNIGNYNRDSVSGSFNGANSANMNGNVNNGKFDNINWDIKNNGGGTISSGTGSDGIIKP